MKCILSLVVLLSSTSLMANTRSKSWSFNTGRSYTGTRAATLKLYKKMVFSDEYDFEERWKSVSRLAAELPQEEKIKFLNKCLKQKEWFLKSPALKLMVKTDRDMALKWAKTLLKSDRALIVRSDAVAVIKRLKDTSAVSLLWSELYAPKNFKGSASLWIRPQIVKTLTQLDKFPDLNKWKNLLEDSDYAVQKEARRYIKGINF